MGVTSIEHAAYALVGGSPCFKQFSMRPADQFCCGCSVGFGVKLVLIIHLLLLFTSCASTVGSAIGGAPMHNIALLASVFGWCLVGIPIVCLGLWGAWNRTEAQVRFYWYYLLLTILLDMFRLLYTLFVRDVCADLTTMHFLDPSDQSFACGVIRIAVFASVWVVVGLQLYAAHLVWSYCEEIRVEGSGPWLSDLFANKSDIMRRERLRHDALMKDIPSCDFYHAAKGLSRPRGPYPSDAYPGADDVSSGTNGLGGGPGIFGSAYHDTSYPPAPM